MLIFPATKHIFVTKVIQDRRSDKEAIDKKWYLI